MSIKLISKSLSVLLLALTFSSIVKLPAVALPVGELEPDVAVALQPGNLGFGTISSGVDFDPFITPQLKGGDEVFAYLWAAPETPGNEPLDPVLSIIDSTGEIVIFNDDGGSSANAFKDSMAAGRKLKRNSAHTLKVDGFGSSTGPFQLNYIIVDPSTDHGTEIEPNDSFQTATPISAPAMIGQGSNNEDFYSFFANSGEKIQVIVDNDPFDRTDTVPVPTPSPGFTAQVTFPSQIQVLDKDGTTNLSVGTFAPNNDGSTPGAVSNGAGSISAPSSGTFFVRIVRGIAEFVPDTHPYRLVVLVDGAPPLLLGACCGRDPGNTFNVCNLKSEGSCNGHFGGVGTTCIGDEDGDGIVDGCDSCPELENSSQEDNDGDAAGNACEACPDDRLKFVPGACGCGTTDSDNDADGVADCNDSCPSDSSKTSPGACGCGSPDSDANANGVIDCQHGPGVRASALTLASKLAKLSPLPSDATTKQKNARAVKVQAIKALLSSIRSKAQAFAGSIVLTQAGVDLNAQALALEKSVNAAIKANSETAAKKKSRAVKAAKAFANLIAP